MSSDFALVAPSTNLLWKSYPVGDVFNPDTLLGLQTNCKAWHLMISPPTNLGRREVGCKIVFRHNYATGVWVLIINGEAKAKHAEKLVDNKFALSFKHNSQQFDISVERNNTLKYTYTLKLEGHEVKEIREKVDISLDEPLPKQVLITDVRPGKAQGKSITLYRLCCDVGVGEKIFVERRYSEFVTLNDIVRSNTAQHIRSTLPKLPGKVLNPFFDQTNPDFVHKRREALQNYIKDLLTNSKVRVV